VTTHAAPAGGGGCVPTWAVTDSFCTTCTDAAALGASLPDAFTSNCTTCVVFPHPHPAREATGTLRLMAVLPLALLGDEPREVAAGDPGFVAAMSALAALVTPAATTAASAGAVACVRGELHAPGATAAQLEALAAVVSSCGLPSTVAVATPAEGEAVGYVLHSLAPALTTVRTMVLGDGSA